MQKQRFGLILIGLMVMSSLGMLMPLYAAGRITPQTTNKVVFLYYKDLAGAQAFQAMLTSNGTGCDLMQNASVTATNLASYQLIIIGPDMATGQPNVNLTIANWLNSTSANIFGIGVGGVAYTAKMCRIPGGLIYANNPTSHLGKISLYTNVVSYFSTTFNTPFPFNTGNNTLFSSSTGYYCTSNGTFKSDVHPLSYNLRSTSFNYWDIIGEGARYVRWGFNNTAAQLTNTGWHMFMDIVTYLLTYYGGTPAAPTNLRASAGTGSVYLTWTAPTGTATVTGYKLYRGTSSGSETLLKTLGNVINYNDTAVVTGNAYYYEVTALGNTGESARSAEASATPTKMLTGSVAIMICNDVSGSMQDSLPGSNESKYNGTQDASHMFVNLIGPSITIGLAIFSDDVAVRVPLAPNTAAQAAVMNTEIENMSNWDGAFGGTDIYLGLNASIAALEASSAANKFVILMTDGQTNEAPTGYDQFSMGTNDTYDSNSYLWHWANDSASPVVIAANHGITIDTIGFGDDVDPVFLGTISNRTGGNYYYASDVLELVMEFANLGNMLAGWVNQETFYGVVGVNQTVEICTYTVDPANPIVRVFIDWNSTDWTFSIIVKNGGTVLAPIASSAANARPAWVVVNATGYSSVDVYIYADPPAPGSNASYAANVASNSKYVPPTSGGSGSNHPAVPGYPVGLAALVMLGAFLLVPVVKRKRIYC